MSSNEKKLLQEAIERAFEKLYSNDKHLIYNRGLEYSDDSHVSERGIVFRFGIYFEEELKEGFYQYNLDAEYNRNFTKMKDLPSREKGAYPDLILHKRGNNENNLLVLEFKPWWNNNTAEDSEKIKEFMDPNGKYKYTYGAAVLIEKNKEKIEWISWEKPDEP